MSESDPLEGSKGRGRGGFASCLSLSALSALPGCWCLINVHFLPLLFL
jgi:hypothetical protein